MGLYLSPVIYPSVPQKKERFKLSLMATHTQEDLDETADIIERVYKEFNLI